MPPSDKKKNKQTTQSSKLLIPKKQIQDAIIKTRNKVNSKTSLTKTAESIESILLQVQLRWAGQMTRMEDIRMSKAVFFSQLQEGKRDDGAPRKRYKDRLKNKKYDSFKTKT